MYFYIKHIVSFILWVLLSIMVASLLLFMACFSYLIFLYLPKKIFNALCYLYDVIDSKVRIIGHFILYFVKYHTTCSQFLLLLTLFGGYAGYWMYFVFMHLINICDIDYSSHYVFLSCSFIYLLAIIVKIFIAIIRGYRNRLNSNIISYDGRYVRFETLWQHFFAPFRDAEPYMDVIISSCWFGIIPAVLLGCVYCYVFIGSDSGQNADFLKDISNIALALTSLIVSYTSFSFAINANQNQDKKMDSIINVLSKSSDTRYVNNNDSDMQLYNVCKDNTPSFDINIV